MILSINVGGTAVQREYDVAMRNANEGVRVPPADFDELETAIFSK
jgi:hypothetical protein